MNPWLQLVAGNILVASLIGGLAWLVGRSGRRAPLAHILWVAFFVKLITPSLILLPIHVPENWLPATAASYTTSFPYRGLDPPRGFWNQMPHQPWASFSLTLPGARLVAESDRGILIEVPGRESLRFSADQLSAVVEIPSTQRVVIGDRDGLLRL